MAKYYSVKLKRFDLTASGKAYKAEDFNGNECFIPFSQVSGIDYSESTLSYWISEWILEKKNITYSKKKCSFECKDGTLCNSNRITTKIVFFTPKRKKPNQQVLVIEELKR